MQNIPGGHPYYPNECELPLLRELQLARQTKPQHPEHTTRGLTHGSEVAQRLSLKGSFVSTMA